MGDAFAQCPIPGLPSTDDGRQYWPAEDCPEAGHDGRRGNGDVNRCYAVKKGDNVQAVYLKWEEKGEVPAGAILAEFVGTGGTNDRHGPGKMVSGYQAIAGAAIPGPMDCAEVDAMDVYAEFQQRKPWRSWVVLVPKGGA